MSFKETLDQTGTAQALRVRILPPTPKMAKAATALAERMMRLSEPQPFDLDALQIKLFGVADTGDWTTISERDLRNTCFCLWRNAPPLAGDARFLRGYFGALQSAASRIATKLLVRAYFLHFDPWAPGIRDVARYLEQAVSGWSWEWATHHRDYRLFNPEEAPHRIAEAALANGRPRKFLETLGLKGQLAHSPFGAACFRAAAITMGRRIRDDPQVALAAILTGWATQEDGRLAFYSERNDLASALLLPWENADPQTICARILPNFSSIHIKTPASLH